MTDTRVKWEDGLRVGTSRNREDEWEDGAQIWLKYFIRMREIKIVKPFKIVYKGRIRKSNRLGEFDQSTLYTFMEMSQWDPFEQLINTNLKRGQKGQIVTLEGVLIKC
jgi:hypothetical protein